MYSKGIQKIVFIVVLLVIVGDVYKYLAIDYQKLPSDNWSKDETLFSYKTETNYNNFFGSQLSYVSMNETLSIIYIDNDKLRFKSYNKDLTLKDEGVLTTLEGQGEEIYASIHDDSFEMVIKVEDDFYCYMFDGALQLKGTYVKRIDQPNYYVSNGHIVIKENNTLEVISSKGSVVLEMPNLPYDYVNHVTFDGQYTVHYLTIKDGERYIVRDVYTDQGKLVESLLVTKLLSEELRLGPLDFEVVRSGNTETYKLNIKDLKSGMSYLNYYQYNLETQEVLVETIYERFQDKTNLISSNEMIGLFKGGEISSYIGKNFYSFYNVMIYNFETEEIKPLTKTYNGPREYTYIQSEPYDYLIWGELKKGEMTLKIASNDPEYIKSSQVFTRERILDVFYETIEAFMKIPTYTIINAVSVFAMTMLIVLPCYMLFVTFFEKHHLWVLGILIILHNAGKILIHVNFLSKMVLPEFLQMYSIPIFIATNILAFYNYKVINHHMKLDNPIVEFVPFFLTDIILHTLIFGPFIMMRF
ncbi:MAG: hypothetical protein JEZ08_11455 [Clostridiales bacterium]|nr:hypothetical protein [Clostridiales bacterium]